MFKIRKYKTTHEINPMDMDHCVYCRTATEYGKEISIKNRVGYIQRTGQLCRPCYLEHYGEKQIRD